MAKFRDSADWDYMSTLPARVDSSNMFAVLMAGPNEDDSEYEPNPLREIVSDAIQQLDEKDRFVIEAIYVWGKSYSELSEMLGFASKASAHGAVKTAEKHLRDILIQNPKIQEMLGE